MPPARAALGVLVLCTLLNMLSRGVGESFAVFLLPVAREFGADRAALTSIYSTYMLVIGLVSPIAGQLVDRLGPRRCYGLGLSLFGCAYLLAGSMTALWQMQLWIGVLSAIGATMLGMVPASSLASRWFREHLPTAMGILSAALGIGMLLVAPLMQAIVERWGWRQAYTGIGVTVFAMLALVWWLPWTRIAAGSPDVVGAMERRTEGQQAWTVARALRTQTFWALSSVMFFTSLTTYAVNVQLVAYMIDAGFSPMQSASIFGMVGMSSIVGMLSAGVLAERRGERWVATLSYSSTLLGIGVLALLPRFPSIWVTLLFVLLFGTMQGSRGPLVAVLASRHFPGAMGRVFGMVMVSTGLGAAVGSAASGLLYDHTGSYLAGLLLAAFCAACGLTSFWVVKGTGQRT